MAYTCSAPCMLCMRLKKHLGSKTSKRSSRPSDRTSSFSKSTPGELAERGEARGRPGHPKVIWPYLARHDAIAIPMEPEGRLMTKWSDASRLMGILKRDRPWRRPSRRPIRNRCDTAFQAHRRNAADTQDGTTSALAQGYYLVQAAIIGEEYKAAQQRWDAYVVEQARDAGSRTSRSASARHRQGSRQQTFVGHRAARGRRSGG